MKYAEQGKSDVETCICKFQLSLAFSFFQLNDQKIVLGF